MLVSKARAVPVLAALGLAAALIFGVIRLLALRFEHGDVYPPYSTLRTDPLGARVLYEALDATPGVSVSRGYRPLTQLKPEQPITLFYAGAPSDRSWTLEELQSFDELVSSGSRVIFAFAPLSSNEQQHFAKRGKEAKPAKSEKTAESKPEKDSTKKPNEETLTFEEAAKRWGFQFETASNRNANGFKGDAVLAEEAAGLDEKLTWHSPLYFTSLGPEWTILYVCKTQPVVIEREWGTGSIVLISDSFFLSNEALRDERHTGFLAWLAGPSSIVFDEEQHGVTEQPNTAMLIRKYRLQGAVAALLFVAALFIWKSVAMFVPVDKSRWDSEETVPGRDSTEGLINLLRRSVPPSRIMEACAVEWRKSFGHDARASAALDSACAAPPLRDPVAAYRRTTAMLESAGCKFQDTKPHSPHP